AGDFGRVGRDHPKPREFLHEQIQEAGIYSLQQRVARAASAPFTAKRCFARLAIKKSANVWTEHIPSSRSYKSCRQLFCKPRSARADIIQHGGGVPRGNCLCVHPALRSE